MLQHRRALIVPMTAKLLRDAVHGDIELTALEVELMDTAEVQRLRGIKQLGTAYLVYPSAVHTRFEHSLGTYWMARKMVEAVRRTSAVSKDDEIVICVAALLHDIAHIPFGHTLEDERRVLPRHDRDEARFNYFFRDSNVAQCLNRNGIAAEVRHVFTRGGSFRSDLVAGPISADLLDYLRRDAYFCGFSQHYDPRIFQSFVLESGRLVINLEKHGVLRHDALSELVNLLRIRYTLSERVYFHHTKVASGAMISKAVELALREGLAAEDLRLLRDDTLIWILRERYGRACAIGHIVERLLARQLYRPCYALTVDIGEARQKEIVDRYHYNPAQREEAERQIASAAGVEPHQVIVYCPSVKMSLPEAEMLVRLDDGRLAPLSGSNNEEIRVLKEKHKALWKFFVLLDRTAWEGSGKAIAAAREYFA